MPTNPTQSAIKKINRQYGRLPPSATEAEIRERENLCRAQMLIDMFVKRPMMGKTGQTRKDRRHEGAR